MLTIILWKWRSRELNQRRVRYTAEHVNKMCSMLQRHLTLPHQIICLTNDAEGITCETQPIPAPDLFRYGSCWHRLWLFSPEARRLGEYVVSIDLDTVITDQVDVLFRDPPPFKIWRGAYPKITYCGSLWLLKTGAFPWIWDQFNPKDLRRTISHSFPYRHPDCLKAGHSIGSDQAWIALKLPNAPVWTSTDGVLSYRLEASGELPQGARIVNFHGFEDPSLSSCQEKSPWIAEHWS